VSAASTCSSTTPPAAYSSWQMEDAEWPMPVGRTSSGQPPARARSGRPHDLDRPPGTSASIGSMIAEVREKAPPLMSHHAGIEGFAASGTPQGTQRGKGSRSA